jgi:adenine deaminase
MFKEMRKARESIWISHVAYTNSHCDSDIFGRRGLGLVRHFLHGASAIASVWSLDDHDIKTIGQREIRVVVRVLKRLID